MATPRPDDSLDQLPQAELAALVRTLMGEVTRLISPSQELEGALAKLKIEHQAVQDELARLKNLPPRPPQKPSGMDKATDRPESEAKGSKGGRSTERRGSNLDKLTVTRTVVVEVEAPIDSRRKGYEDIVVQDVVFTPSVTCYRRERWQTPDGKRWSRRSIPALSGAMASICTAWSCCFIFRAI